MEQPPPPPAAGGGARRGDGAAGTEHRIPALPPRLDDARSAKCSTRAPVPPWTTHWQTNQREWSNPHPTAARAGARHGDGAAKTTITSPCRAASQRRAIHQIFRAGYRPTVDKAPTDGPKGMEQPPSPRGRSVHTALGRRGQDDRRIPASPPLLNDARTAKDSARSGRKLPHLSTEAAWGKGGEE